MELNVPKLEEMLYENEAFKKIKNIVKNKKRTIFNIIVKDSDELTFSRTLKYFLDPKEEHYLNDYFLREFLHRFIKCNSNNNQMGINVNRIYFDSLNLKNCHVHREFPIKEFGRIDIFIELEGEFAMIIENKLYSEEGPDQTKRYEEWAATNISSKYTNLLYCFLTPDGKQAESEKFRSMSIGDIIPIFNDNSIIDQLNADNKFLVEHFTNWMEELKMTDNNIKKLCQSIYKKYRNEIDIVIENAPTITSFVKEISNNINKNCSDYFAHSGKSWMTISPTDWIKNEKLKGSTKYSIVRLQYDYFFDSSNLFMSLVFPNKDEYINIIKKKSNEIFELNFENIQNWNNWGSRYVVIYKWESFQIDDCIDTWDESINEFSKQILDKIIKIRPLLENELK